MDVSILIADDEINQIELIDYNLKKSGFTVIKAENGNDAIEKTLEYKPDLLILDWMMPKLTGIEVCRKLRGKKDTESIPIIILSARSEDMDKSYGLDIGADDYITKPFSVNELMARVKAVLRRIRPMFAEEVLTYKGIVVDLVYHSVIRDNESLHLGPTEFNLLVFFMENIGRVFSREQLLNHVWKDESFVEPRTVDVHIRRLRKAINNDVKEDYIRTVRSAGYSFGHN